MPKNSEICFDPLNPFPLYATDSYTYPAAKAHAELVDQWLGFDTAEIENHLRIHAIPQQQTWAELSLQSFQTPYCELRSALNEMDPKISETVVDLGSGYNRLAFIMGRHYPNCQYIGIEIAEDRVTHSQQRLASWGYTNALLKTGNLVDEPLPLAEHYFIYDFGHNKAIQSVLEKLKCLSQVQQIQILARGRATRHFILNENPWLTANFAPKHFEHFSLFKSALI